MEKSKRKGRRQFDDEFKLTVLTDLLANNLSKSAASKKYNVANCQIRTWLKLFEEKSVSSSDQNLLKLMDMMKKEKASKPVTREKTTEELLREENERLRKALQYSELRNEALNEVLKIGKEKYGLDLLKKAGAK
jgi:transposase-like protein